MDIYLSSKCAFFLGCGSGIDFVPALFHRPVAYVNYLPFEYFPSWYPHRLFIAKKLWLRDERRFLTFPEIIATGVGRFDRSEQYEEYGLDVVNNTRDEITAVAIEMDERLKGTHQATEEDEGLQRRFGSLFECSDQHGAMYCRIGSEFLRQYRELLC